MKIQILIRRYTQGLVNAIKDESEFSVLSRELLDFSKLLSTHTELSKTLSSPFLLKDKKIQILKEILSRKSFQEKISRFIILLAGHNRLGLLAGILDSLPVFWNEKKGILAFEVASVVPLTDTQRKRLRRELELLEEKPVTLDYRIDPELIGGLCVRRGNIVYDVSIKGNLLKLREKIRKG